MSAATLTPALLVAVGGGALGLAHAAARRRRRLGSLRRQFAMGVAIAIGQMLIAVAVFVLVMVVETHDAVFIALVSAFSGVVAVVAARLLAAGVLRDVEAIRDGLAAVGDGRRDISVCTGGRDELAELAGAANAMIGRLGTEERARSSLLAAISHDLRTPMTSVRLLAEAVRDEIVGPDERRVLLEQMQGALDAVGRLVDDLFELSRLEAGDVAWAVRPVALGELVAETADAMRMHAHVKGVALRVAVPRGVAPARANPERIRRVLVNLIDNAIRHTPPGGEVTVLAEPAPGAVVVEVADTGPGIGAADRARVFEAFVRGDGDRGTTDDGAGLGLAISRAIIGAHGGRIWLARCDAGTRVRFSLPRA